jgi:hypothetical protein
MPIKNEEGDSLSPLVSLKFKCHIAAYGVRPAKYFRPLLDSIIHRLDPCSRATTDFVFFVFHAQRRSWKLSGKNSTENCQITFVVAIYLEL